MHTISQNEALANLPVPVLEAAIERFLRPITERLPDKRFSRVVCKGSMRTPSTSWHSKYFPLTAEAYSLTALDDLLQASHKLLDEQQESVFLLALQWWQALNSEQRKQIEQYISMKKRAVYTFSLLLIGTDVLQAKSGHFLNWLNGANITDIQILGFPLVSKAALGIRSLPKAYHCG